MNASFSISAVILSMVLGLGVTRLLSGFVNAFRARRACKIDWIPLVWGVCLFSTQLQFWWAINNLPADFARLSFLEFIALVLLALSLFLAAALLLPSRPEDEAAGLRAYFEKDGRYAVLCIAIFTLMGFAANIYFFCASPFALWAYLDLPVFCIPALTFAIACKSRRATAVLTLFYIPILIFDDWVSLITP